MIVTLGVLRALEALGLMSAVDAISSVSGGSWAAALYMFVNQDPATLLGNTTEPSELTMDKLNKKPAPLAATATRGTTKIAASLWWQGIPSRHLWVYTISEAILAPFKLDRKDCYMAPNEAAVAHIKDANPQLQDSCFLVPAHGRPKTLVMSGAILAPTGYQADKSNVVSLQMSPDYSGYPFYPDHSTVTYFSEVQRKNDALRGWVVGGGFVETFAFGSGAPTHALDTNGSVKVEAPLAPLSLAKAMGVSSAGPSSALTQMGPHGTINLATLDPVADIWAVMAGEFASVEQEAASYTLGDGGNIDNSGMLALLQRGARRIVWLINTGTALPDKSDVCGMDTVPDHIAKAMDTQVSDKFGYVWADQVGQFLTKNQVFAEDELPLLLCDLIKLRDSGKPAVVLKTLAIQRNDWWGIEGEWEADILFSYNEKCDDFVEDLPAETREEIERGWRGAFHRFPHYLPVFQNKAEATALTAPQVNLLAAQAEYITMNTAELFRKVLAGSLER